MPDGPVGRQYWREAWRLGIEEDKTTRTFVAVDKNANDRFAGVSRWIVPQADGSLSRLWPELPQEWDQEVNGAFFAGMAANRKEFMGDKPHWCKTHRSRG